MFTGIVGDVGRVENIEKNGAGISAQILTHDDPLSIDIGASISCDGVCLTVTHVEAVAEGALFSVDISKESLDVTNLSDWEIGSAINLERAMRIGEEIGGHIVSGHVDGIAIIREIQDIDDNKSITIEAPANLAKFIATKGSVALNGTSLTVNSVDEMAFTINLIPHTISATNWKHSQTGDEVNLEVDMMARYVARLREFD